MGCATEWWREFFDDEYLFLYSRHFDPARTEDEVAAVVRLLDLREGERVLDLCCGDARHAVPLHRRGYRVTGADASAPLLRRGRERRARVLEDGDPGPVFVRADARALPFRGAFDAAILLFNSIGYGTDAETVATLREARASLRRGGRMLVECVHRDRLVSLLATGTPDQEDIGGVAVGVRSWLAPIEGVAHAVFSWSRGGRDFTRELRHRVYTATEVAALLRGAGWSRTDFFGGYDGRPFSLDAPVLVARAWN